MSETAVQRREPRSGPRAPLRAIGGTMALAGVAAAIATNLWAGFAVRDYSMLRETISDLAAGPSAWIMDGGIYALALLGLLGLATGWSATRLPWTWLLVRLLALQAIGLAIVGAVNQYAGQANRGGNIHLWTIGILALLFAASTFVLRVALRERMPGWADASAALGLLWIFAVPAYWFLVQSYWGLFERLLLSIVLVWIATAGSLLFSPRTAAPSGAHAASAPA